MDSNNPTAAELDRPIKLSDASVLSGVSVDALRLRIKRGQLKEHKVTGSRGKPVRGVRWSDLARLYPDTQPLTRLRKATNPTSAQPTDREAKLEEALRETQSSMATAAVQAQGRNHSRELQAMRNEIQAIRDDAKADIQAAREEARAESQAAREDAQASMKQAKAETDSIRRAARRDSLMAAGLCIALVGGVSFFAWTQLKGAANATVLAQGKTIEAMQETQAAQRLALEEANRRAQAEGELSTKDAQLAATQAEAQRAQAQLQAIALGQRIRAGIERRLRMLW